MDPEALKTIETIVVLGAALSVFFVMLLSVWAMIVLPKRFDHDLKGKGPCENWSDSTPIDRFMRAVIYGICVRSEKDAHLRFPDFDFKAKATFGERILVNVSMWVGVLFIVFVSSFALLQFV